MLQNIISRVIVCWSAVFILTLWCTIRAIQFTKFAVRHDVTDSHCVAGDEVFSRHVAGGLADCAARCESPACLGVFYTEDTEWCQGCSGVYQNASNPIEASGASYAYKLPCQPPWFQHRWSCYYHPGNNESEKRTFFEAWNFCKSFGGSLALIDDAWEDEFVKIYLLHFAGGMHGLWSGEPLPTQGQHYIGFIRRKGSAAFDFYGDGRPMNHTSWLRSYEPEEDTGDRCVVVETWVDTVIKNAWGHENCNTPKTPLCEKDAAYCVGRDCEMGLYPLN